MLIRTRTVGSGRQRQKLLPLDQRGPLRVMYLVTSMPVGGAETLLVSLLQGMDRTHFAPHLCCLKALGVLGERVSSEVPTHHSLLAHKYDVRIWSRLTELYRQQHMDAIVTVGAGDKMFWGRLAAASAGLPVVLSALHSTGWPDSVNWLNRQLTPLTDAFIAVASNHGDYMTSELRVPARKVKVIPNGIDTERFRFSPDAGAKIRRELQLPSEAPLCGIVAALRPEKNHELFLSVANVVRHHCPQTHFLVVGDGPQRQPLEQLAAKLELGQHVHFLGSRDDIPALLAACNLFVLTSNNEANPVSILEALACEVPVVAPRVGSIEETVLHGVTGYVTEPGDRDAMAEHWLRVLGHRELQLQLGRAGRQLVQDHWSLRRMVEGYEKLIRAVYVSKVAAACRV